ncbi:uncharacterized protein A1O9_00321, partial [Exophiala aquamarina CBS 119918]
MIYAKLQISSPAGEENTPSDRRRVSGRLSVFDDSVRQLAFDTVQLCFRGVIASCIGRQTSLEDIITLTDIKSAGDFRSHTVSNPKHSTQAHYVDFFFKLPTHASASAGLSKTLPLTTSIEGSTSVTQSTAMNDRHIVQGECEVSYWIEAQFRCRGQQVGSLHQPVRISGLYPDLHISLWNGQPLTIGATPDLLARWKMQKSPKLSVSIYEPEITIIQDLKTGKRQISIPIAVAMEIHTPPGGTTSIDGRQSLKCSVDTKWQVSDRFSIIPVRAKSRIPLRGEVINRTSTTSTQKSNILFRPLPVYEKTDTSKSKSNQTSYVAASALELSVPDAISQPSLCWNYFARSYTLDLSLTFHGFQGAPKYKVTRNIPITVTTQYENVETQ